MSAFSQMKQNRASAVSSLVSKLEESQKGGGNFEKDKRLYYPERDAQGNGYAVIRFLPAAENNPVPFVKTFSHGFKGPGGWLIENCPTTVGKDCPVCTANSAQWQIGSESSKKLASSRKRKVGYTSNILVVEDPKNPENVGKVFLFNYGGKIFDMIMSAAKPEFEVDQPVNVFDFWAGANFKLKIVKKDGNTNYDKSSFAEPSSVSSDDDKLEEIYNSLYDLREFTDETRFKSADDIAKRFARVSGAAAPSGTAEDKADDGEKERSTRQPTREAKETSQSSSAPEANSDDVDPLSFFNNLAPESN